MCMMKFFEWKLGKVIVYERVMQKKKKVWFGILKEGVVNRFI